MRLLNNWKRIIRRAWSIRLGIISALFAGAEVVLPMFVDVIPRNLFAGMSFISVAGAVVARVIAQPEMHVDD